MAADPSEASEMTSDIYWIINADGEASLYPDIGLMRVIIWGAGLAGGSSVDSGKMPVAWQVV